MRFRINLLGTWIDNVGLGEAEARIGDFVHSGLPHQVVTANVDFLRLAGEDAGFRDVMNQADLVLADGMPLVWASRRLDDPLPCRITGIDMILICARMAVARGYSIFLLGAEPGVADEAGRVLQARFPGLRIAGTAAPPPLPMNGYGEIIQGIRAARPDMLFVAFGAPRQDEWIHAHLESLGVPVCIGVGGSLDMLAGRVRRAPLWMQGHGLEWLYRLRQEPARLWKRYFLHDLPVFVRLMTQARSDGLAPQPIGRMRLVEEARPELAAVQEPSMRAG